MTLSIYDRIYSLFGDSALGVFILFVFILNFFINYEAMRKNRAKYRRWDLIRLNRNAARSKFKRRSKR